MPDCIERIPFHPPGSSSSGSHLSFGTLHPWNGRRGLQAMKLRCRISGSDIRPCLPCAPDLPNSHNATGAEGSERATCMDKSMDTGPSPPAASPIRTKSRESNEPPSGWQLCRPGDFQLQETQYRKGDPHGEAGPPNRLPGRMRYCQRIQPQPSGHPPGEYLLNRQRTKFGNRREWLPANRLPGAQMHFPGKTHVLVDITATTREQ